MTTDATKFLLILLEVFQLLLESRVIFVIPEMVKKRHLHDELLAPSSATSSLNPAASLQL
jgi:hypothetical protein